MRRTMDGMSTMQSEHIPQLTLGWRLRMAMGSMSTQEMADELGVDRSTVSRWLNDKGAPPRRIYVRQWALVTGVPFEWLDGNTGRYFRPPFAA